MYVKDFEQDRWMLWWDGKGGTSRPWGLYRGVTQGATRLAHARAPALSTLLLAVGWQKPA